MSRTGLRHVTDGSELLTNRVVNLGAGKRFVIRIPSTRDQHLAIGQHSSGVSIAADAHMRHRYDALNGRVVDLGRVVVVSAGYQHAAVAEQRRGLTGAALFHLWPGSESSALRVIYLRSVECRAPGVRTAAGYQDAPV